MRNRIAVLCLAAVSFFLVGYRFLEGGAEFVPRIFEGDAVVTIRRPPSISLAKARELDFEVEKILHEFPEVKTTLGMTGRGEVAIDVVGNDNTDMLVRLRPLKENLRGRDLLSWVKEAQIKVSASVPLASNYHMEWGGQFENFDRATKRLRIVLPLVVVIILGMLLLTFRKIGMAIAVFLTVPLSLTGGMLGLLARGMPFSLSAAVGFIALGGVAVLNRIIMGQQVMRYRSIGESLDDAIQKGSTTVLRAVLTTTAVAACGFLPMALSSGAGSEVQRPLATAVVFGIVVGAFTTTLVLPGAFRILLRADRRG